jgi:hypothetical protein
MNEADDMPETLVFESPRLVFYSRVETVTLEGSPYAYLEQDWGQPEARHYHFQVEGDTMRGRLLGEPHAMPSSALSRIRSRQPYILRHALGVQKEHGDPVQNLAELLGSLPGSQEDWEALVDESY